MKKYLNKILYFSKTQLLGLLLILLFVFIIKSIHNRLSIQFSKKEFTVDELYTINNFFDTIKTNSLKNNKLPKKILFSEPNLNYEKKNKYYDINCISSDELVQELKIFKNIANRIINYRNLLGGYFTLKQLNEVYGIDSNNYNFITKQLYINDSLIIKIDINNCSYKTLLKHPYFNKNICDKIFNTRKYYGKFSSINELNDIFNDSILIKNINPYILLQ